MRSQRFVFVGLYAASGAAALIFEIVWTRLLTLILGHTVAATSTVLAAFMGGMAIGAWAAGILDDRYLRPAVRSDAARLRIYAALELVVALSAFAMPYVLSTFSAPLKWAYQNGEAPLRFGLLRIALSAAALGIPTAVMGATFPIAAKWFVNRSTILPGKGQRQAKKARANALSSSDGAGSAGLLYAANSAGAALGALAAGLWLIPWIGVRATTWVGLFLNSVAAAGALLLARTEQADRAAADARTTEQLQVSRPEPRRLQWIAPVAAASSGFVGLIYEVLWTRLLGLVFGPTIYAFSLVVASFIIGISLGSAAAARLLRRPIRAPSWLAACLAATAVAASAAAWFAAMRLPLLVAAQVGGHPQGFDTVLVRQTLLIIVLLLPVSTALGAVFPLALAVAGADRPTASDLGRIYASNTLGAIGGALAGGFVLLPALGLQSAFRITALIGALSAACVWFLSTRQRIRALLLSTATVGVTIALLWPGWDRALLAGGAYKYASYFGAGDFETERQAWKLLSYADGATATVTVRQLASTRSLVIDGKVDASNAGDMLTQRLLGLLPTLLHREPREVCVIGLGSGVTAAATLARGTVRRLDVVEISPEVARASDFFKAENGEVLKAPGVRLIAGDGRSHLRLTSRRYDVIVSEPSNPWMAGIASLFTREFFESARSCLTPGGVICQWAHTYDMRPEDLKSIVATFTSVFPDATLWLVGEGDLLLVGTNGSGVDISGVEQHWKQGATPRLLADVAVDERAAPFALFSLYAGGPAELARFSSGAVIQRDDRMALEFSAPRAIYGGSETENLSAIRTMASEAVLPPVVAAAMRDATDVSWTVAGNMELKADAQALAYDRYERAVRRNTRNSEALTGLTDAAAGAHREADVQALLTKIAADEKDNSPVRIELSRLLAARGDVRGAADAAKEAMTLAPNDPRAGEQLASVLADAGDAANLTPLADALVRRYPGRDGPRYYQATASFLGGRVDEAIERARALVAKNPNETRTQNLLGVACAAARSMDCARSAFEAALASNPRDATTYVNLGVFNLQSGDAAKAAAYFSTAVTLDRTSQAASQGLAEARAALVQSR